MEGVEGDTDGQQNLENIGLRLNSEAQEKLPEGVCEKVIVFKESQNRKVVDDMQDRDGQDEREP